MRKVDELFKRGSCLNRAQDDEMVFVLLARDSCAPAAIRFWCGKRILDGKNRLTDPQIVEALACADRMEEERPWVTK